MKKLKKVNPLIWISIIVVLVICTIVVFVIMNKQKGDLVKQAQENETALAAKIQSMYRAGYVAATDIRMGEMITETNVVYSASIVSDIDIANFITEEDFGKCAVVNIPGGTPVMLTEVSDPMEYKLTERQCGFIYLNSNLVANDFVDVRIMFPNGVDKVVVPKTPIKSPQPLINACYLWLTEAQNDLLSAAIVDANLNGAKIYVNKYINPAVEEASIITYQPNIDVIEYMKSNVDALAKSEEALREALNSAARDRLDQNMREFYELYPEYVLTDEIVEGASQQVVDDVVESITTPTTPSTEGAGVSDIVNNLVTEVQ